MFGSFKNKAFRLSVAIIVLIGSMAVVGLANQPVYSKPALPKPSPTPFLQPITVQPSAIPPVATPTPLVKKTGSVLSTMPDVVNPAMEMAIPGYSGVLVETLDGKTVKESYSNYAFNPASNVKIATAYAVIKTFTPDYRFQTNVYTDGTIDPASGTLNGNVYVSGRDPIFNLEHGVALANALNKLGIRQVNGDLVVNNSFVMSLNGSYQRSAEILFATLDYSKRSAAAANAWNEYLMTSGKFNQVSGVPSVSFSGRMYIDILPTNARLLFSHESAPLREIVKVTLCYSNNFIAEKLGDMLGGAYAVAGTVQRGAGIPPEEFTLQTSSGLGINRVTPRAQMKLLRAFRAELARYKMTFADVMPIAGIDPGTLQNRFKSYDTIGSVVAKTGTLGNTDGGASSLSGEMQTKNGRMLFVIFNQKGTAGRFRNFQDAYISMIQSQNGGAASLGYSTIALPTRMSNTRIVYPTARAGVN